MAGTTTTIPLVLDNKDVVSSSTFDVFSPATGKLLYKCSSASVDDAIRAADSAQKAFKTWSKTKLSVRRNLILKAADIYERRKEELIGYMQEDIGALRPVSEFIVGMGLELMRDTAGKVSTIEGAAPALAMEGQSGLVYKEPYGVILGIAPWNAPFILGVRAVILAIAAGNTVVFKGSELSPRCHWAIADVFREAGFPEGVINVLFHRPADAADVTNSLIEHPAIRKINFTGSTLVGALISSAAGRNIKPVLLELGGKASSIILDDADLEKATNGCAFAAFANSGQICMSTERIIVQRSVSEKFQALLTTAMQRLDDPSQPPPNLVRADAVTKNKWLITDAVSKGATILYGNPDAQEAQPTHMRPVVIANVTPQMSLHQIESFGPTVSLYVVDTEEEAIELANDTDYGLTSAVYTENLARGLRVARQIESG
ncbi:hypothetical protein AJ80_09818 [Polytolypa hystricis UAMH7299]|uniref:Aldehyde dehydrogenase domain-containing protein n=1 Tax=Polytolypa hystricis (strain UAMH7299) TaxID=1447883 RepID=A0A2B7WIQ5_POLH7|nr:hypothetical protein AJ80_09818 [Polytolypa hystricis UAMH7299]